MVHELIDIRSRDTIGLLRELCNAVINYRLSGEKNFIPVNNVLMKADKHMVRVGVFGIEAKENSAKIDRERAVKEFAYATMDNWGDTRDVFWSGLSADEKADAYRAFDIIERILNGCEN